jgi:hypothetical protein
MSPSSTPAPSNPFPGLRSYETPDAPWFFGRRADIDGLQKRVEAARFVAVVGASGSGKSSIVKAGLVPALDAADAGPWCPAVFRPGTDPIGEMAAALAAAAGESNGHEKRAIETTLRRSSLGLVEAIEALSASAKSRLLVVVDQFDEVFRFKEITRARDNGDEAVAFVNLLIEAARDAETAACIVLTMRSDFLGRCEEFRGLPEAVSGGMYLIPRLTRSGLRAAIEGPIERAGASVAPRLVQQLLNDIGDASDQLPVLQHALMRTWDRWRDTSPGRPMDLDDYTAIGGMQEALSRHADSVLATLADDAQRDIAEVMFKRLTERGRDGNETRRPTPLGEIAAVANVETSAVAAVVEHFRTPGCSLLMAPETLTSAAAIDISHESLIRLWSRLRTWIGEEAKEAEHYVRVANAACLHLEGNQSLYRHPELPAALSLFARINEAWAIRYDADFALAAAFLQQSREALDRAIAAERVDIERGDEVIHRPTSSETAPGRSDRWGIWGPLATRYAALAAAGGPYKMLSIDGGGIRSLLSIEVLARLESLLSAKLRRPNLRLCEYFDLIGGTSTGAIIAAGLARGMLVAEIREFYQSLAREMFIKRPMIDRLKTLYEHGPLMRKLQDTFGAGTTLEPEYLKTLLLIVTKNATTDTAWPVMSNPSAKYNDLQRKDANLRIPLWQLVRASAVTQLYFPPETVTWDKHDPSKRFVFTNGGATPYNNPSFLMARMATEPAYRLAWPTGESRLLLVSVGAGAAPVLGQTSESTEDLGLVGLSAVAGVLNAAQFDQDLSCRTVGRCSFGDLLDREVADLVPREASGAPPIPLTIDLGRSFLYVRYDASLTQQGLSELGMGHVDALSLQAIDNLEAAAELEGVGRAVAERVNLEHLGSFVR